MICDIVYSFMVKKIQVGCFYHSIFRVKYKYEGVSIIEIHRLRSYNERKVCDGLAFAQKRG